jgi:hypothetical protein
MWALQDYRKQHVYDKLHHPHRTKQHTTLIPMLDRMSDLYPVHYCPGSGPGGSRGAQRVCRSDIYPKNITVFWDCCHYGCPRRTSSIIGDRQWRSISIQRDGRWNQAYLVNSECNALADGVHRRVRLDPLDLEAVFSGSDSQSDTYVADRETSAGSLAYKYPALDPFLTTLAGGRGITRRGRQDHADRGAGGGSPRVVLARRSHRGLLRERGVGRRSTS